MEDVRAQHSARPLDGEAPGFWRCGEAQQAALFAWADHAPISRERLWGGEFKPEGPVHANPLERHGLPDGEVVDAAFHTPAFCGSGWFCLEEPVKMGLNRRWNLGILCGFVAEDGSSEDGHGEKGWSSSRAPQQVYDGALIRERFYSGLPVCGAE